MMMDRSRSKGDYLRTLERRITDLQKQVDVLVNRDQSIDWIVVGSSGAPAFQNGWGNYGSGWPPAAFSKSASGVVYLRGLVNAGTVGATIFTLPAGFRPGANSHHAVAANGVFAYAYTITDGTVYLVTGASNGWLDLISIKFRAEL